MIDLPYSKVIDVADFTHPALVPHLRDIGRGEMLRFGLSEPVIIPDSKQWQCAMMLRTLAEHGVLRPGALLAGVGAGTEEITFALAAKGAITFPIDRYLEQTGWSDVAPAGMMLRPAQFSPYPFERGAVVPVHADARALPLPDTFFDGVYSAGSIQHFGSLEAVAAAAEEIGRILKPGGIAAISTEFRLEGPNDQRWFSDDCILFTSELLDEYIVVPSGLELIGELSASMSQPTFDSRVVLVDFLERAKRVKTLADKRNAHPNLVLYHSGFLFCSVHLALRKPTLARTAGRGQRSAKFEALVAADATRASGILTRQIEDSTKGYGLPYELRGQSKSTDQRNAALAEMAERYEALRAQAEYVTGRGLFGRLFFRPDGRPVKPLRRLLFHTSGAPRRFLRVLVLNKNGVPRSPFAHWMGSREYQGLSNAVKRPGHQVTERDDAATAS